MSHFWEDGDGPDAPVPVPVPVFLLVGALRLQLGVDVDGPELGQGERARVNTHHGGLFGGREGRKYRMLKINPKHNKLLLLQGGGYNKN